jgi:RIO-like serine/threonine protein kinase
MATRILLKRGSLGDVRREADGGQDLVVRDWARARPGCGWLARRLARREAAALARLAGLAGVPRLIAIERGRLVRSYLPGRAMHEARPKSRAYFRAALGLVRRMHRAGVAHNDLAKEANWLSTSAGEPAIVDFQLAVCVRRRNRLFRAMAREDLRHLLKHKRHYCADQLTARQHRMLAEPSWPARFWRAAVKPVYLLVTRKLLGWPERRGAEERQRKKGTEKGSDPFF